MATFEKPSPAEYAEQVDMLVRFGRAMLDLDLGTDKGMETFRPLREEFDNRNAEYRARFGEQMQKAAFDEALSRVIQRPSS